MLLRVCNLLLALFCALPPATFAFLFVNPASHGGQTSFSQNPVYAEKSILEVQWTSAAEDQDATVALFQVDISRTRATDVSPWTIGDLEYIAEGQDWDRTSRRWIVITDKDLSVSPVFMMMLFVTGATNASDETIYFNITSASSTTSSSSASATTSIASVSTAPALSTPTTSAVASGLPSTSSTASASDSSADMPTSAKLGIGIGIPAAAIVGVVAGWLAFRRRKTPGHDGPSLGEAHRSQEEKSTGFGGSTIATPRPASSTVAFGPPAPASSPPTHWPASNAPAQWPAPSPPSQGLASSTPVYEAHNDQYAPSELYAPNNTTRY